MRLYGIANNNRNSNANDDVLTKFHSIFDSVDSDGLKLCIYTMGVYVLWNLGVYGDVIPLKNFDCLSLINFRIQFIVCMLQNVDV